MADATLTYSREFEDFMLNIFKEILSLKEDHFCEKLIHNASCVSIKT